MDVIYGLIPLMLVLGLVGVVIFIWSVRSGQYDDLEGDANRILMDEDDPLLPGQSTDQQPGQQNQTPETDNSEHKKKQTNESKPHKNSKMWPDAD